MTRYSHGFIQKPSAGGDPSITFTWDPENDEALPGGVTFTRASVKQQYDGTDFTELSSGAIPEDSVPYGGGQKGFFPEPLATNVALQSSDLTDAAWTNGTLDVTDDGVGSLGLEQFDCDSGASGSTHYVSQTTATGAGSAYMICKSGNNDFCTLVRGASLTDDFICANLNTGAVSETGAGVSSTFVENMADDWHQLGIRTSDTSGFFQFAVSNSATPGTGRPNFFGSNLAVLNCHIQREDTDYPTSPIITLGTATARQADVLDTGVATTTAFSALLDLTLPSIIGSGLTVTLLGPDTTAEDILRVDPLFNIIMDDGGTPVTIGTSSAGARIKVSYGRDALDRSGSLNGATAVDGDAPGAGHVGENFELGSRAGINQSRCIHHLTTLYNVKKSDAELEALST